MRCRNTITQQEGDLACAHKEIRTHKKNSGLPVVANEDGLINVQLIQELDEVCGKVLAGIGLHIKTNALGLVLN